MSRRPSNKWDLEAEGRAAIKMCSDCHIMPAVRGKFCPDCKRWRAFSKHGGTAAEGES